MTSYYIGSGNFKRAIDIFHEDDLSPVDSNDIMGNIFTQLPH